MGHKVNPISFRLGIRKNWKSRWFSRKRFPFFLEQDHKIKELAERELGRSAVESIDITRSGNVISVVIKTARPGLVIGRGGKRLEDLQKSLIKMLAKLAKKKSESLGESVKIEIEEIRRPDSYARLVGKNIAEQLERRMPFRRIMKQSIEKVVQQKGVEGVKIALSGRLAGADIARTEHLSRGKIPLAKLRANIDYSHEEAVTTYGVIGIKVWIYKGDIFEEGDKK